MNASPTSPTTRRSGADPSQLRFERWWTHLSRALKRQCPNCGGGPLFRRWIIISPSCPRCHLLTDRGEPDYFIGSYVVNFVTAEFMIALGALVAIGSMWPDVDWTLIKWALWGSIISVPIFFYPWAKTIWLAIDLVLRPATLSDLEAHGENLASLD